ncbi:hypothetical protein M1523_03510 [Patescibacteria group bacterium]|nr:hypothetical protein [Patescibacteria group bacterium]MCL5092018.1 hypothetical protein [Patescibacteria group bacterium]
MKVFFTASQKGKNYFDQYYKRIAEESEMRGYLLLNDGVLATKEEELGSDGKDTYEKLYHKTLKALQEADVCVFETTVSSSYVGYLISKALELNKPTIVLYFKDNAPVFLLGIHEEKLIIRNYNDNNLTQVLSAAYESAGKLRDKRFNFFISPDLLNYLETASKTTNQTKSMFIRKLILEHRNKNSHNK